MVKLEKQDYERAYALYKKEDLFFPLISSVLLDIQDGIVLADSRDEMTQIYVNHHFGFSQLFGKCNPDFEEKLQQFLLLLLLHICKYL